MEQSSRKVGMIPLFLMAAVFSLLAPLFWTHVEAPPGATVGAYENPEVYGRILPSVTYGFTRLRAGEWPLWSPQQWGGVPFFSNPAHGLFQPLNLIFLAVPPVTGLALHAFAGLFLTGLFAALLLRVLGTAYLPAMIGGLVYAFCGATVSIMSMPELLGTMMWVPLLYLAVLGASERPHRLLATGGGLLVAVMLLAGAPAVGAVQVSGALAFGVLRIAARRRREDAATPAGLRCLVLMVLIGVVLSAVQWVPWFAWLRTLATPAEALWPSAVPGHLPALAGEIPAALLVPRSGGVPGMAYFGAIPLMLIPPAFLHRQRRFEVLFFLASALLWIGLAVWGASPGVPAEAWKVLIFPGAFGVAMVAGIGADRLLLTGRDPRSPLIWGSVLAALLAALVLLVIGTADTRGRIAAAVIVMLPFFVLRVRWIGVCCGVALAFLIFLDFREASRNVYQHPFGGPANWLASCLPALQEAEAQALGDRLLALPASRESVLPANVGLAHRVKVAGGAHWPLTVEQGAWWSALGPWIAPTSHPPAVNSEDGAASFPPQLLNYLSARVIAGEGTPPWIDSATSRERMRIRYLTTQGRVSLWKNESAHARARWVPHWQAAGDIHEAIKILTGPDFPGRVACVVDTTSAGFAGLVAQLPPGLPEPGVAPVPEARCSLVREYAEELVISVESTAPGLLVLSDSHGPGWRALVDGESAPILRVNGLFRGVFLPPGTHTIVFNYAPLSVTLGILLSGVGLVLLLAWLLFHGWRGAVELYSRSRAVSVVP